MTEEEFQKRLAEESARRSQDKHYCSCAGGPTNNVCPYKGNK